MSAPSVLAFLQENRDIVLELALQHVGLAGSALLIATVFGVAAGVMATRYPKFGALALEVCNIGQAIPSIAVLGLMVPLLGIGFAPALVALALRGILPIYLNTYLGIRALDPAAREAATGIGMRGWDVLARIDLPLSSPVIMAGIRTAAVEGVAIATLAAFIGAGGLGDLILQGIAMMDPARLLGGAIPAAMLALLAEVVFGTVEWFLRRVYRT
jgi:osmoprotectant transport system permease protein